MALLEQGEEDSCYFSHAEQADVEEREEIVSAEEFRRCVGPIDPGIVDHTPENWFSTKETAVKQRPNRPN